MLRGATLTVCGQEILRREPTESKPLAFSAGLTPPEPPRFPTTSAMPAPPNNPSDPNLNGAGAPPHGEREPFDAGGS